MAFEYNCDFCKRHFKINSRFHIGEKIACPECVLGKEGKQAKYHETSTVKNAGYPEGFRYPDDTAKYKYNWDKTKKKWVDEDGKEKPVIKEVKL